MPFNSRLDICHVMSFIGVVSLLLPDERLFPSSPAAERRQNETWNITEVLQNVEKWYRNLSACIYDSAFHTAPGGYSLLKDLR